MQWRSEEEVHGCWEILHESVLSDVLGTEDSTSLSLLGQECILSALVSRTQKAYRN